jgi:hypothetical protein
MSISVNLAVNNIFSGPGEKRSSELETAYFRLLTLMGIKERGSLARVEAGSPQRLMFTRRHEGTEVEG